MSAVTLWSVCYTSKGQELSAPICSLVLDLAPAFAHKPARKLIQHRDCRDAEGCRDHKLCRWGPFRLSAEHRTELPSSQAACRAAASALPPLALPAGRCTAASFFTPAPGGFFFSSSMLVLPSSFLARCAFALSSALTRPVERRDFVQHLL